MPNLSVIVPASRNADDIVLKFSQLRQQLDTLEAGFDDYEILLIDIKNQLGQNKLTRNQLASQYGVQIISLDGTDDTTAALSAGIALARAKFLLTVDLTRQYPLEKIGLLIDQLSRADLVVARFRRRRWAKLWHRFLRLPPVGAARAGSPRTTLSILDSSQRSRCRIAICTRTLPLSGQSGNLSRLSCR